MEMLVRPTGLMVRRPVLISLAYVRISLYSGFLYQDSHEGR